MRDRGQLGGRPVHVVAGEHAGAFGTFVGRPQPAVQADGVGDAPEPFHRFLQQLGGGRLAGTRLAADEHDATRDRARDDVRQAPRGGLVPAQDPVDGGAEVGHGVVWLHLVRRDVVAGAREHEHRPQAGALPGDDVRRPVADDP